MLKNQDVKELVSQVYFLGLTSLGSELIAKGRIEYKIETKYHKSKMLPGTLQMLKQRPKNNP